MTRDLAWGKCTSGDSFASRLTECTFDASTTQKRTAAPFDTVKVNLSSFPGTKSMALASSSSFAVPKAPVALAVPFSTAYNECAGCVHPSSLAPPYRNRGEALSCDAFLKPAARAT